MGNSVENSRSRSNASTSKTGGARTSETPRQPAPATSTTPATATTKKSSANVEAQRRMARSDFDSNGRRNTNEVQLPTNTVAGPSPSSALPTPAQLPEKFPELRGRPLDDLKAIHKLMSALVSGTFAEKATALSGLVKQMPNGTGKVLERLGISDKKLAKLATDHKALAALGTLTDSTKGVADRAAAAVKLAAQAGDILKPEDLRPLLQRGLDGLAGAEKLVSAIGAWTDPNKSGIEKAQATLELAMALKDVAGKFSPNVENELRKLDGGLRTVGNALTLFKSDATLEERSIAAAQLATDLPALKKDAAAFKGLLERFNLRDAAEVVRNGVKAADVPVKGLDPSLSTGLSADQTTRLKELSTKFGASELEGALAKVRDPGTLDSLVRQLSTMDPSSGKRFLTQVSGLTQEVMQQTLADPDLTASLARLASKADDATAKTVGKLVADMDVDALRLLTRFTDNAPADALKTGFKALGPAIEKLGGNAVGVALKTLDTVLGKMGVKITGEVAGQVFKNIAKAVPFLGAVPGAIDAVRYGKEAVELQGKQKDLGFFAVIGATINTADAVVGTVLDFTGVGAAVSTAAGIPFGAAELAIDIAFSQEKAKYLADPEGYQAPGWMKAVNLAGAALMGPQGLATLAGYYGPEGAAQLVEWGTQNTVSGAITLAKNAGIQQAEAVGNGAKLTRAALDALADVVRNPTQYGRAIYDNAVKTLTTLSNGVTELASDAKRLVGEAITAAKDLALKGLQQGYDTLKYIAQNPGEVARQAVDAVKDVFNGAVDFTTRTGKKIFKLAVDTLDDIKDGYQKLKGYTKEQLAALTESVKQGITQAVNKAADLGEKAIDLVVWAATHPDVVATRAKQVLEAVFQKGGQLAREAWDEVKAAATQFKQTGQKLVNDAIDWIRSGGSKAIDTLKYVINNPGQATKRAATLAANALVNLARKGGQLAKDAALAVKEFVDRRVTWAKNAAVTLFREGNAAIREVAQAWKTNLSQGAKDVMAGLANLGDAGVDALKDIAGYGGQLAASSMGYMASMARRGNDVAAQTISVLSNTAGEVASMASATASAVKSATNGEISVGGYRIDLNPLW